MSAQKTPMQLVHEEHGGKEKLVDKILGNLESDDEEDQADLKQRLLSASNKKLLRLAQSAQVLKEKYGSREKLVAKVAETLGRAKDADFVKRLDGYTQGRLLDMARTLMRRGGGEAAPGAAKAAAPARPRAAQAPAKPKAAKPAAKKPAAKAKAAKPAKKGASKKPAGKKGKK
jgi:hypothetical protein